MRKFKVKQNFTIVVDEANNELRQITSSKDSANMLIAELKEERLKAIHFNKDTTIFESDFDNSKRAIQSAIELGFIKEVKDA